MPLYRKDFPRSAFEMKAGWQVVMLFREYGLFSHAVSVGASIAQSSSIARSSITPEPKRCCR